MNAFHQCIDLKLELEDLYGRHVDLVTWRGAKAVGIPGA
jgi:predicted nucleotidyltransferase